MIDGAATVERLRFLREPEVIHLTGYSRSSIRAFMAAGRFPQSVPLGARAVAWIESEVQAWMAERVAAARGNASVAA